MNWHLLPHADSDLKFKASLLQGRFTGDPSFDYELNVTHRVGGGDSEQKTTSVRKATKGGGVNSVGPVQPPMTGVNI